MRDDDQSRRSIARRSFLRMAGAASALSVTGGLAAGQNATNQTGGAATPTPGGGVEIDPAFGYPGLPDEEVPAGVEPAQTVQMVTEGQGENVLGDFYYDPVGVSVDAGAVVQFVGSAPEHTVTAYHNGQNRWQRVPQSVPPFSSPVVAQDGFWLYEFTEPGVYDVFCASHEFYGMAMRLVVGDQDEWTVVRNQQGRPPFGAAQEVLDQQRLDPSAIVEAGTVAWGDLNFDQSTPSGGGN